MKVKELIEELQKLDQERNIWQFYDFPYACWEPEVDEVSECEAECLPNLNVGDYAFKAG